MARRSRRSESVTAPPAPPQGGRLRPLGEPQAARIVEAAFDILARIGMAGLDPARAEALCASGAHLGADDRLRFPRAMVEDALARAPGRIALPGFAPHTGLEIGGGRVHLGTGGAAVRVLEAETGAYRDATLADLYAMMRVLDAAPSIAYGVRPLVASDLADPLELDLNTAFACLKGTAKPIGLSVCEAAHLRPVIALLDAALGAEGAFRARPFAMGIVVHVVPPLRFAADGVEILAACLREGMIPQICSAGQAGATSPVTLAGALAQGLAECLAGLVLVDHLRPGAPCIYALMPFVSDLRTGAMSGGGGEGAVASAAAAQLLARLGLPSTVCAGMTDAKLADAQAGYEKGYTVALAAEAGADMINLSAGMLGSIMVASPEALAIDDDMGGAILRAVRGIEVSDAALDLDAMARVVAGEGHYLGEPATLARMKTDYVYPRLGDRRSVAEWQAAGSLPIWERARAHVAGLLAGPPPAHLSRAAEDRVRAAFPIRLPEDAPRVPQPEV
ncbi:MAG: trimethylamine methyltransferase family protein [Pseudomonadota bacterium]